MDDAGKFRQRLVADPVVRQSIDLVDVESIVDFRRLPWTRLRAMTPRTILDHYDRGDFWPDDASRSDVAAAYRDALDVRALRIARGEKPVGYKIGFTNRTIWDRYRVFGPIWGTVWDSTLVAGDAEPTVSLSTLCQPRLEPELAFGLKATPPIEASVEELFACVAWLAPSFEVVQSHRRDWKFTAADTVADGGLHGRLLIGAKRPVTHFGSTGKDLNDHLASTRLRLYRDDVVVEEGSGRNVLDGPLLALHHFMRELQGCPDAPTLGAGDVVTTGTWTDAWPIEPGQVWRSEFDAPFGGLTISLR